MTPITPFTALDGVATGYTVPPDAIQFQGLGTPNETATVVLQLVNAENIVLKGISYTLTPDEYAAWGADNSYVYNLCLTKNAVSLQ